MKRFFSDDSFWNQPLTPEVETDKRNDDFLSRLAVKPGGPFWINCNKYTIPVYDVDDSTPRHDVLQWEMEPGRRPGRWAAREKYWSQGPGFGKAVPIPEDAKPDPGTDRHMALVDWKRGQIWDMWACRQRPDGRWESRTGMVYDAFGSGVWQTSDFAVQDGESIHFHGPGRASGVPIVAGLAMRWELLAGRIEHKIAMATWHNAYKQFVFPATWTDGFEDGGLPEGAVMQLDPALDLRQYDLSPAARALARAMQVYGMVNLDNAGGNVVYAEGLYGKPELTWDGILSPDELERIPLDKYRVIKLGSLIELGDSRENKTH